MRFLENLWRCRLSILLKLRLHEKVKNLVCHLCAQRDFDTSWCSDSAFAVSYRKGSCRIGCRERIGKLIAFLDIVYLSHAQR